jgi:hypothetical protein
MNSMAEFDNKRWQAELREQAAVRETKGLQNCQFPGSTEIQIGGTRKRATITMTKKGLKANMQTDASAFEAWSLALFLHCGVKSIQIGLDAGAEPDGLHYERFLYRLQRFSELFPERGKDQSLRRRSLMRATNFF